MLPKSREAVAQFKGVEIAETYEYVCRERGQELIAKGIKEQGIERVVVAACTPKMHLDTFRRNIESPGINLPSKSNLSENAPQLRWLSFYSIANQYCER